MPQPKVLIVDDDDDDRQSIARYLKLEGFSCRTAATGTAGLDALLTDPPAAAILDFGLEPTSIDICRQVRARPGTRNLNLLLFVLDKKGEAEAFAAGASGVIYKPFHLATIAARLRELVPGAADRQA